MLQCSEVKTSGLPTVYYPDTDSKKGVSHFEQKITSSGAIFSIFSENRVKDYKISVLILDTIKLK